MAGPLRGGGGVKAGPLRKKITFFKPFFFILLPFKNKNYFTLDKFRWPLSSRGGGKALVAWPLVDELFFAASLINSPYLYKLHISVPPYVYVLYVASCPSFCLSIYVYVCLQQLVFSYIKGSSRKGFGRCRLNCLYGGNFFILKDWFCLFSQDNIVYYTILDIYNKVWPSQ